jgi:hypothetical protein
MWAVHLVALKNTQIHQVLGRDTVKYYQNTAEYQRLIVEIMGTLANRDQH